MERGRECHRAEETSGLLLDVVREVTDLGAVSVERLALAFVALQAVEQRLEALVVETVLLHQVNEVELVGDILAGVCDREEIPLGVLRREVVRVDHQVVLEWRTSQTGLHLHSLCDVA